MTFWLAMLRLKCCLVGSVCGSVCCRGVARTQSSMCWPMCEPQMRMRAARGS
ncbi:hypothetical protein PR003_g9425 [Phytophthora rubi]|uniref:Secreted protein n=1 Tax=Phytophthora rubi TaxID=129364 RepID=A0A6A4FGB3_9STRA|nr:hypothetical protein PR002_g9440 [Phytophthora rubi]KAE9035338.1 hypothetical protein PR001_g9344 [Phytophthora rubi]KAE9342546.1 hypothetical protein PR003_g9425 [Phytophthora rubi]